MIPERPCYGSSANPGPTSSSIVLSNTGSIRTNWPRKLRRTGAGNAHVTQVNQRVRYRVWDNGESCITSSGAVIVARDMPITLKVWTARK